MLPELTHLPVHWVDGMKITRSHLTDFEHYVTDQTRTATGVGLTDFSYGLLPVDPTAPGMTMQILADHAQQLHIRIAACRAVTLGGHLIEITERNPVELQTSVPRVLADHQLPPEREYVFAVVLSVDPFTRVPTGEPRSGEVPPRHPYTLPTYQIHLVPFDQIQESAYYTACLTVGKLLYRRQELKSQADYIPACASVLSHPSLLNWYRTFGTLLLDIETNGFKIIQKVKNRNASVSLSDNIQELMERLVYTISSLKTTYRWMVPQLSPAYLIESVLQIVHTCRAGLGCLNDREREEMLGYFAEWSEVTPGVLDAQIQSLTQLTYNHVDVSPTLVAADEFIRLLADLLLKLSQLEYIGKRKGQVVFIGENPVGEPGTEKPKPRWSPL